MYRTFEAHMDIRLKNYWAPCQPSQIKCPFEFYTIIKKIMLILMVKYVLFTKIFLLFIVYRSS